MKLKNGIDIVFPDKDEGSEEIELVSASDKEAENGESDLIVYFLMKSNHRISYLE